MNRTLQNSTCKEWNHSIKEKCTAPFVCNLPLPSVINTAVPALLTEDHTGE